MFFEIKRKELKLSNIASIITTVDFFFILSSFYKIYCCAGWRYIVAFTKVLTIYQVYHTWKSAAFYCDIPTSSQGRTLKMSWFWVNQYFLVTTGFYFVFITYLVKGLLISSHYILKTPKTFSPQSSTILIWNPYGITSACQ
jgi:hypothetical protein